MADITREIERKYALPELPQGDEAPADGAAPRVPFDDLAGITGVEAVVTEGVTDLDAVYWDTPDLRLASAKITLRRREGGKDAGWHLKLPVSDGVRDEIHAPLSDDLPAKLAGLLNGRLRGAAPRPLMRLRTARDVSRLVDAEGSTLVEISVDAVHARRLRGGKAGRPTTTAWTEVEAELAGAADPALLDKVDKRMRKAGLRPSDAPSKLARALAETAPDGHAPESVTEPTTAGEHTLAYLGQQADALAVLDPAVRLRAPDSVHQMRVATRRMRSALRSYRNVLDRGHTDPLGDELKWLAGELGLERDNEVLTERLRTRIAAVPGTLLLGPVEARLRRWSSRQDVKARKHSLAALDSDRYLALLDSVDALLADPPLRKKAAGDAAPVLAKAVLKEYGRLAGRVEHALALGPGEERDLALHAARKAAKRARYAAEAATPALGKPAKTFAKRMKAAQQLLGEHQDSVVTRNALRTLAVEAHHAGESAFTWGLLHGEEHARALHLEHALPDVWAKASRPSVRAKLAG